MGHSQNQGTSENQPEKGALDTDQDKSVEHDKAAEEETAETEETKETVEPKEPEEGAEEQTTTAQVEGEEPTEEEPEKKEEAEREEEAVPEAETEGEKEVKPEEAEEEKEKEKPEKAPEEEEIVEERTYTIPLRRAWISPRRKRAPRSMRIVKSFIERHMKVEAGGKAGEEEEKGRLVISREVNEKLWSHGIEKPPRNIRVRAVKDKEGTVTLYLAEGD